MDDKITNKVNEARIKKGIRQEDLAKSVGVTRQTIIAIEKGNYTPSVLLALKISKFFKLKVEDLFEYEK